MVPSGRHTAIDTHPLTPDRWRDFVALMNSRFDTRRCWCMWPRLPTDYKLRTGAANRRTMKKVVDTASAPPGVLAYVHGAPVGWCAVAPRDDYPKLDRLRATRRIDDPAVWSVVCFYVLRTARRTGVSRALLAAAIDLARKHGAQIIEGYPVERTRNPFRGFVSTFGAAGFEEASRNDPNRPIMRYRTKVTPRSRRPSSA